MQEALTNTIRHAPAAMATVTFTYEPGYITVSVADSVPSVSFAPVASMPTPGGPAMTSARPAAAGPATAGARRGAHGRAHAEMDGLEATRLITGGSPGLVRK